MHNMRFLNLICLILLGIFIHGCGNRPTFDQWSAAPSSTLLPESAEWYLQQAQEQPEAQDRLFTFAALKLCNEAHITLAKRLAQWPMQHDASPEDRALRDFARASIAAQQHHVGQAQHRLNRALHHLPQAWLPKALNLKAKLLTARHQNLSALRTLQQAFDRTPEADQPHWLDQHWRRLGQSGSTPTSLSAPFSGWVALAQATALACHQPSQWPERLASWRATHIEHPAQAWLQPSTAMPAIHKIGVIVPQHGVYAQQGNTLLYGIMAQLYRMKQQRPNHALNVVVYDASQDDPNAMLAFAERPDLDAIIGPLTKKRVAQLNNDRHLQKPILAFNPPQRATPNDDLYWIDLTQQSEIRDLAKHVSHLGYRHPLVIQSATPLGEKIGHAFSMGWPHATLQEDWIATLPTTPQHNDAFIQETLGITTSHHHGQQIAKALQEKVRTIPSHRPDIDAIILAMGQKQASAIIPLIRYHYSGDLPLFGPSIFQQPVAHRYQKQDLEHVRYLGYVPPRHTPGAHMPSWPKYLQRHPNFFRLGQDSLRLLLTLPVMQSMSWTQCVGLNGIYQMRQPHVIQRNTVWMTLHRGRPKRADTTQHLA